MNAALSRAISGPGIALHCINHPFHHQHLSFLLPLRIAAYLSLNVVDGEDLYNSSSWMCDEGLEAQRSQAAYG